MACKARARHGPQVTRGVRRTRRRIPLLGVEVTNVLHSGSQAVLAAGTSRIVPGIALMRNCQFGNILFNNWSHRLTRGPRFAAVHSPQVLLVPRATVLPLDVPLSFAQGPRPLASRETVHARAGALASRTSNKRVNLTVRPVTRLAALGAMTGSKGGVQGARPSRPAGYARR